MVVCVFQFYPVCNFGKFINFGLGSVGSERVKMHYFGYIMSLCHLLKFVLWLKSLLAYASPYTSVALLSMPHCN